MNLRRQLTIVLPLSFVAAWAGIFLARTQKTPLVDSEKPPRHRTVQSDSSKLSTGGGNQELTSREIIASASSAVLWEWLDAHAADYGQNTSPHKIFRELYAREGIDAWYRILASQNPEGREKYSDQFLGMLAETDPWLTYELFLKNKDSFGEMWAVGPNANILSAACAISADKFIEVMESSGYADTHCWFTTTLPADFNFAQLISHLEKSEHMPSGLPSNLIARWAKVFPKEAAQWLVSQPKPNDQSKTRYLLDEESEIHNTLLNLAESKNDGRDEGLAAFATLPSSTLEKSWESLVEKLDGKINSSVLDAATRMGVREDYLVRSLLETRGQALPDVSWATVPDQDKWRAVQLAEQRWEDQAPSPVDERARVEWRLRLQKAWEAQ